MVRGTALDMKSRKVVLAPWDIRSQHPSFSTNGCPKEPAQGQAELFQEELFISLSIEKQLACFVTRWDGPARHEVG